MGEGPHDLPSGGQAHRVTIDIERCPWCGSGAVTLPHSLHAGYYVVCECMTCQARGPLRENRFEAVEAWNHVALSIEQPKG